MVKVDHSQDIIVNLCNYHQMIYELGKQKCEIAWQWRLIHLQLNEVQRTRNGSAISPINRRCPYYKLGWFHVLCLPPRCQMGHYTSIRPHHPILLERPSIAFYGLQLRWLTESVILHTVMFFRIDHNVPDEKPSIHEVKESPFLL